MSLSTSASVRYSRVRSSVLGGRRGVTVRFTVVGDTNFKRGFAMEINLPHQRLFVNQAQNEQSAKGLCLGGVFSAIHRAETPALSAGAMRPLLDALDRTAICKTVELAFSECHELS